MRGTRPGTIQNHFLSDLHLCYLVPYLALNAVLVPKVPGKCPVTYLANVSVQIISQESAQRQ